MGALLLLPAVLRLLLVCRSPVCRTCTRSLEVPRASKCADVVGRVACTEHRAHGAHLRLACATTALLHRVIPRGLFCCGDDGLTTAATDASVMTPNNVSCVRILVQYMASGMAGDRGALPESTVTLFASPSSARNVGDREVASCLC